MSLRLKKNVLIVILIVCVLCFMTTCYLLWSFQLKGDSNVTIALNGEYQEKGAKIALGDDDNIEISDDINNKKVGEYKVKYETEILGIKFRKYRTVRVVDEEAPSIELEGKDTISICENADYEEEGYKAFDEYDGDLTNEVKIEENDDVIIYSVKDKSGNKTEVRRYLNRTDEEGPNIKLKGQTNYNVLIGEKFVDPGYEVKDNCSDEVDVKVTGEVNTNKTGNYELLYTAVDEKGNETTVKRHVKVSNKKINNSNETGKKGIIYLTFDDGPSATSTPKILEILKKKNVKATFFVINHSSKLDYLIKKEHDEGHTVGLHSYTHNYKTVYSSKKAFYDDLQKIQTKVEKITGEKSMITRFPGGSSNTVSRRYQKGIMTELTKELREKGYHYFDWNVGSGDAGDVKTSDAVYRNVTKGLSKKRINVVLMHDFENNTKTVNALERIIDYGLANGYIFDKIDMTTSMVTHGVNN